MGIEQFAVGFLVCLVVCILGTISAMLYNFIMDDDAFGWFISMIFACIGLGICLTYIGYMKGVI